MEDMGHFIKRKDVLSETKAKIIPHIPNYHAQVRKSDREEDQ